MIPIQQVLLSRLPEDTNFQEKTTVAVPLCLGIPQDPEDGCHDRFGASIYGLIPLNTLIIQTGGTESLPLCDLMFESIKLKRRKWILQFLAIRLGWGTRSEIANAFSIIRMLSIDRLKNGINTKNPNFKVVIASNKAHLRRIRWFVKIYNTDNLQVEYREALHEFGLKNTLREWIGTWLIMLKDTVVGFENLRDKQERRFLEKF